MIIKALPKTTRFLQPVAVFDAIFNSPTAGRYDLATTANTGVELSSMNDKSIYLIDQYSFSATIADSDYLQAIDTANIPRFRLRTKKTGQRVYQNDMPIINYVDSGEAVAYYASSLASRANIGGAMQPDFLIVDALGALIQPAVLVGLPSVRVQLTFNIYEVIEAEWIDQFWQKSKSNYNLI